jgi:hypothetical protein
MAKRLGVIELKDEAKFNRCNRMPVNEMYVLGLLLKSIFRFSLRYKSVAGIEIEGGFDADILGLILIFCILGGAVKLEISV